MFNKPFGCLCQFSGEPGDHTLARWINAPDVYPAGRLDKDSEGLLILTDCGRTQHQISHPRFDKPKTYLAQVEGEVSEAALEALRCGVTLKDGTTKPAQAHLIAPPELWPRVPPVRYRAAIPTSWIELTITEGRNRQVRRMTAAVGFPTLRLVRQSVAEWRLGNLQPGEWRVEQLPPTRQAKTSVGRPLARPQRPRGAKGGERRR
ncbi:MAG: pseudouridine synthase [Neomegalonema sp.]|nr:pseudouridine synthase [Neomegalonema sp.]